MLTITDLHVSYGRRQVLRGISAGCGEPGTVTGLVGPNAAGKSTLVKAIAGVCPIASGQAQVELDGTVLKGRARQRALGYVPQDVLSSASLTVFESVVISARGAVEDPLTASAEALERLGIAGLAQRSVRELSGGQRQLVAVAQMLVRRPHVLLLDEPTSALDLRHQVELLQLTRQEVRKRDAVALVVLHDLNLAARYCDQLLVLADGQVVEHGTPAQVLRADLLEQVYGLRARVLDDEGTPVVCPVATDMG
ncbi:ABC transporter ATP-binding protein [Corynebacterium sp. 320]|uniref:ABC transporter ATP-binding protein n=1 Tax=Corynebacterium TaxID=1716 RepID=UPI00125CC5A8|nr:MULTISPECIES: ABC transporter ATP-binding protein [Corynebacterium]KAB1504485.1 ABC transporter ATP-binding protein [Corynebacterium sp. 320]KAB1552417.1 ABC transporter ATP-binding protein [Corynebacterium sp. 321]KAB1554369.1 ABC transporter ATP-binding protein [Corynebacterium sp. 319]KAB3528621.1 ABC transporter ATP-binding protein [Corynebacterium sp. 250]KAB3539888.1 ABC transporter ATP-binding protein [Corynebacterium sp. 366]